MRRFILVTMIGVALFLLPSAGSAQTKEEGLRLFKEALRLHQRAQTHEDLKQASEKYEKALRIFEKIQWKKAAGMAADDLGMIHANWGQYDKAVAYYEKSLPIFRELKDRAVGPGRR